MLKPHHDAQQVALVQPVAVALDERLCKALPVGTRKAVLSDAQRNGIWLHGLLEYLTMTAPALLSTPLDGFGARDALQRKLNIPPELMSALWQQAQAILHAPHLSRFFDGQSYVAATNEVAYVNAAGGVRRIDRLVEFEDEVWVLDYKTGNEDAQPHLPQLEEYRIAMQAVYADKAIRCALIFANGKLAEI